MASETSNLEVKMFDEWLPVVYESGRRPGDPFRAVVCKSGDGRHHPMVLLEREEAERLRPAVPTITLANGEVVSDGEITIYGQRLFLYRSGKWEAWINGRWYRLASNYVDLGERLAQPSDIPDAISLDDLPPRLRNEVAIARNEKREATPSPFTPEQEDRIRAIAKQICGELGIGTTLTPAT